MSKRFISFSRLSTFILGFTLLAFHSQPASAGISVMGGVTDTLNNNGSIGFLGGLGLSYKLIELDGLYISRSFSGGTSSQSWFEIPAMLRFHATRLSLGVGAFYDVPISNDPKNCGLIGSLRIAVTRTFFVDARFSDGIFSKYSSTAMEDAQIMLGFHF